MNESYYRQEPLLSAALTVHYPGRPGVLRDAKFSIAPGEVLGLVGQSGSGKSTISLAILKLLGTRGGVASGHVHFQGRNLLECPEREMRRIRGRQIGLVLQSPLSALNPVLKLRTQFREVWSAHATGSKETRDPAIRSVLESVSLPTDDAFLDRYPAQLSVGQAQRLLIAMGILHRPSLLIADEPTSALDAITQAEILKLFARLNQGLGTAMLYISHDLLSVASLCHRVVILHEGRVVETGATDQIFHNPQHPYTKLLVDAMPANPARHAEADSRL
jgi:ABC-type glutathione transport system ATPase component